MADKGGWAWMLTKIIDKELFLENLYYVDPEATNKINGFSHVTFSTSVLFFIEFMMAESELVVADEYKFENWAMPTLIEEIKSFVLVKNEFENWEKVISKCFFLEFQTIRILMQVKKLRIVELNTRLQVLNFWLSFSWRKLIWWRLRVKSLKSERK